jgi:hypothetical protein
MFRATPLAFIGSSREELVVAKAIQAELVRSAEFVIWHQGLFGLSVGTLESLVRKSKDFDFAVLVLTPDDVVVSRGEERASPRDNVLFELGLFIGTIGRERCFMVVDRSVELKLPSDLAGITPATYQPPQSGTWQASVGPGCTAIEEQVTRLGPICPRLPVRIAISQGLHAIHGYTVVLTIENEGKQEIPPYDVVLASDVGSWRIFPAQQNGPLLADQRREHRYPVLATDRTPNGHDAEPAEQARRGRIASVQTGPSEQRQGALRGQRIRARDHASNS